MEAMEDLHVEWPEVLGVISTLQKEGAVMMEKRGGEFVYRRARPVKDVEPVPPKITFGEQPDTEVGSEQGSKSSAPSRYSLM